MVKDIAIYVEGGGDTAQTLEPFRRGMSAFLKPVVDEVRKRRIRWRVVPCGGRKQAYDAFVDALVNESEVFNVLLVDSEEPVSIAVAPWEHLKNREGDKWDKPAGADDARCQMPDDGGLHGSLVLGGSGRPEEALWWKIQWKGAPVSE